MGGVELPVLMESLFCVTELQRVVSMCDVVIVGVIIAGYCHMGERRAAGRRGDSEIENDEVTEHVCIHITIATLQLQQICVSLSPCSQPGLNFLCYIHTHTSITPIWKIH